MCGVVKLSISSLTAHTAGHVLHRDVGKVRPSVWVQRVPTSNRTRTSPSSAVSTHLGHTQACQAFPGPDVQGHLRR
jgi:hypothetical protein